MICNKCGNNLENSAKYCNKCGNHLIISSNSSKQNHKNVKKTLIIIFILILLILNIYYFYIIKKNKQDNQLKIEERTALENEKKAKIQETIDEIKSHYGKNVVVSKDTNLLDDNGNIIGTIYKNTRISLNDINIDENLKYFSIESLNYKIDYKSVDLDTSITSINKLSKENRYKKYIPYNKNLVTKDTYSLYYNGNKAYTFNRSDAYPIIINDYEDYYYIEFNNRLYSIHKDDIKEIVDNNNSEKKNKDYITTLCYHRIYKENDNCSDSSLCIKKDDFDTQAKYLQENNYVTLTAEEMYMYIMGNVQIEKGVLITFDDGWLLKGAIEVLEKYDLNGISFVGTLRIEDGSFSLEKTFNSDNIEVQSHTHNMHRNWVCPKTTSKIGSSSQGGAILCESEEYIFNDLKKSIATIEDMGKNKVTALAYPFYDFNDRAINIIKESGIKLAFTGTYGKQGRAIVGTNPYTIPRIPIRAKTSLNTLKSYL